MRPTFTIIHTAREEDDTWLYETLVSDKIGSVPRYYRRRLGSTQRTEIDWAALQMVMGPKPEVKDWNVPEPAGVYEQPAFGPWRAL